MSDTKSAIEGFAWLCVLIVGLFFETTRLVAAVILGLFVVGFGALVLWSIVSGRRENEKQEKLLASARVTTNQLVSRHLKTLANRRDTLVRVDQYGVVDGSAWNKEVQHFVDKVIRPALTVEEAHAVREVGMNAFFQYSIEERVAEHCDTRPSPASLPADLSPLDFEGACAAVLRREGWSASTTKGSGDQGADVIAEKDGMKLVLQCKLYTGAVGNKSIQEVISARIYYNADHAAVVCKTCYTKAAKELAQASNVAPLHFGELLDYAVNLAKHPAPVIDGSVVKRSTSN